MSGRPKKKENHVQVARKNHAGRRQRADMPGRHKKTYQIQAKQCKNNTKMQVRARIAAL